MIRSILKPHFTDRLPLLIAAKRLFTARGVITLALAATVLLSLISYRSVTKLNSLGQLVNHTREVQSNLQRTYSALSDADSQLKTFLITGDSTYYHQLIHGEHQIRKYLGTLTSLTRENDIQNRRIFSLDSLIHARWAYMDACTRSSDEHYDFLSANIENCNKLLRASIQKISAEQEEILAAQSANVSEHQSSAPLYLLSIQSIVVVFLLVGFFLVKEDVKTKERLRLEMLKKNTELQQQRDFIQGIFDNSIDVIFIYDPQLNVLALNKRARELYDPSHDSIGKNILDLFPQARGSHFIQGVLEALNGNHVHSPARESTVYRGMHYESFFVPLYSTDKKVIGGMAIHHDVTEIMKMTAEVRAINTELQKSNRELEQFAYVASHDLQEPLRKILTYTEQATENLDNREALAKNLNKISGAADRMSTLISDILDYSRVSTANQQREVVDLNEVLDQVLQDFELTIGEKEAIIESNVLPKIMGSRQPLIQVFGNIISNALKFCRVAPCVKIVCKDADGKHEISFSDNGIGFDQAFAEQIFKVFHRLHHRMEFPGTGIGLALCKRIIENHGGSIQATSVPNNGTTITITIPHVSNTKSTLSIDVQNLQASVNPSLDTIGIAARDRRKDNLN